MSDQRNWVVTCSDSISSPRKAEKFDRAKACASRTWVTGNPTCIYPIERRNEAGPRARARTGPSHTPAILALQCGLGYSVCANGYFGRKHPRIMRPRDTRALARAAPRKASARVLRSCWTGDRGLCGYGFTVSADIRTPDVTSIPCLRSR